MTDHPNIYCALAAAQAEMSKVIKDAKNDHFKSKYADLAGVVAAVRPALNAHGIALFHQAAITEMGHAMKTILVHGKSDTRIECEVPLIVNRQDMQGYKSATTYAKRIGLESVTGVAPDDDDDGNAAAAAAPHKHTPAEKGLNAAFYDGIRDRLPDNASPAQHAEAIADAIIEDMVSKKSVRGLEGAWDRHKAMIERIAGKFPELRDRLIDAFEVRKNELTEPMAAE